MIGVSLVAQGSGSTCGRQAQVGFGFGSNARAGQRGSVQAMSGPSRRFSLSDVWLGPERTAVGQLLPPQAVPLTPRSPRDEDPT